MQPDATVEIFLEAEVYGREKQQLTDAFVDRFAHEATSVPGRGRESVDVDQVRLRMVGMAAEAAALLHDHDALGAARAFDGVHLVEQWISADLRQTAPIPTRVLRIRGQALGGRRVARQAGLEGDLPVLLVRAQVRLVDPFE